uniref:Uncharacterized protein n=1 Tax=Arundo donax TaxID=35708 RepID=A0A0A8Z1Y4_ARUDO
MVYSCLGCFSQANQDQDDQFLPELTRQNRVLSVIFTCNVSWREVGP